MFNKLSARIPGINHMDSYSRNTLKKSRKGGNRILMHRILMNKSKTARKKSRSTRRRTARARHY